MEKYKKYYDNAIKDEEIQYFEHIAKNFPYDQQSKIFLNAIIMMKARIDKISYEHKKKETLYKTLSKEFVKLDEKNETLKKQLIEIKEKYFKCDNSQSVLDKVSSSMLGKRTKRSCNYDIQEPVKHTELDRKQKKLKAQDKENNNNTEEIITPKYDLPSEQETTQSPLVLKKQEDSGNSLRKWGLHEPSLTDKEVTTTEKHDQKVEQKIETPKAIENDSTENLKRSQSNLLELSPDDQMWLKNGNENFLQNNSFNNMINNYSYEKNDSTEAKHLTKRSIRINKNYIKTFVFNNASLDPAKPYGHILKATNDKHFYNKLLKNSIVSKNNGKLGLYMDASYQNGTKNNEKYESNIQKAKQLMSKIN